MDSDLFDQEELIEIFTWDIADELKIKLLEYSNAGISIVGKDYSTSVCIHILNNNLLESDLKPLFESYEKWDGAIQQEIFNLAIENITTIIDNSTQVSDKLKVDLLGSNYVDRQSKIKLLIAMMPNFNNIELKENLILLNLNNYARILEANSRPKFEINDENEMLLIAFKEKGLIYDYIEKEGYYKIIRQKPSK